MRPHLKLLSMPTLVTIKPRTTSLLGACFSMPLRISIMRTPRLLRPRFDRRTYLTLPYRSPPAAAHRLPSEQRRCVSILSSLSDNPGAYKSEKRRGRGPASGLGKTSGRGHKGQKQHGKVPAGFEGGQTPQHVVHGSRGFTNVLAKDITSLPLSRIQSWIAQGRIDPTRPITPLQLISSRCIHGICDGIKLLASSKRHTDSLDAQPPLEQPLNIVVSKASAQAIAIVEAAGGTVTTRYYTKDAMRRILKGDMHSAVSLRSDPETAEAFGVAVQEDGKIAAAAAGAAETSHTPEAALESSPRPGFRRRIRTGFRLRLPDPTSRKELEYYRDSTRRGYLAHEVHEGDSPSLYFKTPRQRQREIKESRLERKRRRLAAGAAGEAVEKRTVRAGERIRLW